ncbi:MAG: BatD family protein [Siphonobacter sp.]
MSRRGTTTTTSTNTVSGATEIVQRITQNYYPSQPGNYVVTPFTMTINGQSVQSMGGIVIVTEADPKGAELPEESEEEEETPIVADAKQSAFLLLQSNRSQVYVGEGFNLTLGFYVADDNPVGMDFYALNMQLGAILKQIRPANCWEENFGIQGEPQVFNVVIKGRKYTEYRLFQAVYFPLNAEPIRFPAVSLKMVQDDDKKRKFISFQSKTLTIQPIALPVNAQRNQAVTGDFSVQEKLSKQKALTGKSITYSITIHGSGNLAPVAIPLPENDAFFDFYPPSIQESITRRRGQVTGEKTFTFQIIPKQAGNIPLSAYFRWLFFNPRTGKYVNWHSSLTMQSTGEQVSDANSGESIFDGLPALDSTRPFVNLQGSIMSFANALLTIMGMGMIYIFWRGRRG